MYQTVDEEKPEKTRAWMRFPSRGKGEKRTEHTCPELQTRAENKWLDILASSSSTGRDCPYQTGCGVLNGSGC